MKNWLFSCRLAIRCRGCDALELRSRLRFGDRRIGGRGAPALDSPPSGSISNASVSRYQSSGLHCSHKSGVIAGTHRILYDVPRGIHLLANNNRFLHPGGSEVTTIAITAIRTANFLFISLLSLQDRILISANKNGTVPNSD
jgi:hypothetical protein